PVRELLAYSPVGVPMAVLTLLATAGSVVSYLAPFYLDRVVRADPMTVGFTILAFPLTMGSIGPIGGYLADRFGGHRIALAGSVILLAGASLLIPLPSEWSPLDVAWRLAGMGGGVGFFAGPNLSDIIGHKPRS